MIFLMVLGVLYYVVFHSSELTFIGDYNSSFVVLFPIFKALTGDFFHNKYDQVVYF